MSKITPKINELTCKERFIFWGKIIFQNVIFYKKSKIKRNRNFVLIIQKNLSMIKSKKRFLLCTNDLPIMIDLHGIFPLLKLVG